MNIYALYKGDKFITEGTMREIAKVTGNKLESLYWLTSPAYKRRCEKSSKSNYRSIFKIDEEDIPKQKRSNEITEKTRKYNRKYYQEHQEERKEYSKKYYNEHKEYYKKYREIRKEKNNG